MGSNLKITINRAFERALRCIFFAYPSTPLRMTKKDAAAILNVTCRMAITCETYRLLEDAQIYVMSTRGDISLERCPCNVGFSESLLMIADKQNLLNRNTKINHTFPFRMFVEVVVVNFEWVLICFFIAVFIHPNK